eukprot:2917770-Alexandrium_andersonii.AAC.1
MLAVAFDAAMQAATSRGLDLAPGAGPAAATIQALGRVGWQPQNMAVWHIPGPVQLQVDLRE